MREGTAVPPRQASVAEHDGDGHTRIVETLEAEPLARTTRHNGKPRLRRGLDASRLIGARC